MHDLVLNSYFPRVNVYGNVDAMATLTSCRTGKSFTWHTHGSNARYFVRRLFPDRVLDFEHFALRRKDMPELTYPKRYLSDDHDDWREEVFKLLWKDEELEYLQSTGWVMDKTGGFISLDYPSVFLKVLPDPTEECCGNPIGVYVRANLRFSTDLKEKEGFLDLLPKD